MLLEPRIDKFALRPGTNYLVAGKWGQISTDSSGAYSIEVSDGKTPFGIILDSINSYEDTTKGSGKVSLATKGVYKTKVFVDQPYVIGDKLYVNNYGVVTTTKHSDNRPSVGVVVSPPAGNDQCLEYAIAVAYPEISAAESTEIECYDMEELLDTVRENIIGKTSLSLYGDGFISGVFIEDDNSDNNKLIKIHDSCLSKKELEFFADTERSQRILEHEFLLGVTGTIEFCQANGASYSCKSYKELLTILEILRKDSTAMAFEDTHRVAGVGKLLKINCKSYEDVAYGITIYCHPTVTFPTDVEFLKDFNSISERNQSVDESGWKYTLGLLAATAVVSAFTHSAKKLESDKKTEHKREKSVFDKVVV